VYRGRALRQSENGTYSHSLGRTSISSSVLRSGLSDKVGGRVSDGNTDPAGADARRTAWRRTAASRRPGIRRFSCADRPSSDEEGLGALDQPAGRVAGGARVSVGFRDGSLMDSAGPIGLRPSPSIAETTLPHPVRALLAGADLSESGVDVVADCASAKRRRSCGSSDTSHSRPPTILRSGQARRARRRLQREHRQAIVPALAPDSICYRSPCSSDEPTPSIVQISPGSVTM